MRFLFALSILAISGAIPIKNEDILYTVDSDEGQYHGENDLETRTYEETRILGPFDIFPDMVSVLTFLVADDDSTPAPEYPKVEVTPEPEIRFDIAEFEDVEKDEKEDEVEEGEDYTEDDNIPSVPQQAVSTDPIPFEDLTKSTSDDLLSLHETTEGLHKRFRRSPQFQNTDNVWGRGGYFGESNGFQSFNKQNSFLNSGFGGQFDNFGNPRPNN